jgi:hypothetical protein
MTAATNAAVSSTTALVITVAVVPNGMAAFILAVTGLSPGTAQLPVISAVDPGKSPMSSCNLKSRDLLVERSKSVPALAEFCLETALRFQASWSIAIYGKSVS